MGFTFQTADYVAGTVLVIERIQSQNYQAGVLGWAIYSDGDAEFNDLVIRGSGVFGPDPGQHVDINLTYPGALALYTGQPTETTPGLLGPDSASPDELRAVLQAPQHSGTVRTAQVLVSTNAFDQSQIWLNAEFISVFGVMTFESWVGFTSAGIWAGTWTDAAGARAGYFMDPTGRVQLRGVAIGGAAALIGTLPVGRRPPQTMEWIMRGQGGVIMCAVTVSTAGAITVTANAATAQASGIRLDAISFPTI